jgi:N-methylhydantoinase B
MNDGQPQSHGILRQVMWDRLLAIVEEQAQTLIRTSFSTTVREAGDLSAGVFDVQGRMLAQAQTGTPGHVNSMACAVRHFLEVIPPGAMRPGDCYVTNDPWLASGHLHDFTGVTPAFCGGKLVGLFAATIHVVDVGGRGLGTEARSVFEEGTRIPIMPFLRGGVVNVDLLAIIRANTRTPLEVEGDLLSMAAAGDEGARRLASMMREFGIDSLGTLACYIIDTSRAGMLAALRALPPGTYTNEMTVDGYEAAVRFRAAMTISDSGIHVDFDGTSPQSRFGINVVMNYTLAYASYGIRCVVAPHIPNNHGSLETIEMTAPAGSILNALPPAPVAARHIMGHVLPDLMLGCLAEPCKGHVPAESSLMWNPQFRGSRSFEGAPSDWQIYLFNSGGTGGTLERDGFSATAFPAGIKIVSTEAAEAAAPILIWRKELACDSAGAGMHRGGLGQVVEIGSVTGDEFELHAMFDRVENAPAGRAGGCDGAPGAVRLASGATLSSKGVHTVPPGDRLVLSLPGGGGYGDPRGRSRERVRDDIRLGYVSLDAARKAYGLD